MPTDANRPRRMTDEQIQTDPTRHGYYGGRNKAGTLCGQPVIRGTKTCKMHSGKKLTALKAQGTVVLELQSWGLGDTTVDPGEVLLRLVTQSAFRCDEYATTLKRIVDEHDGDLRKALTADSYTTTEDGQAVKTGEYIRAMTKLEADERDRCANFSAKAVAAGLAERMVRIEERQVDLLAAALEKALGEMGLPEERQREAMTRVSRHLRLAAG